MVQVELQRANGAYGFEARDGNGHVVKMDTRPESGGQDFGVRPMQLLLMGLGGCSGVDILSILQKQRQTVRDFRIRIEGERVGGMEPSLWKEVSIVFELTGDIERDKAEKACSLSMNKYCSVAETLRKGGTILNWKVDILP